MTSIERFGSWVAYAYLLRVPLLTWAALVVLPLVAVPSGAPAGPLLRGLFSLADLPAENPIWKLAFGGLAFTLVTFAALMTSVAIAVTARIILLDGEARFGTARVPGDPGVELAVRGLASAVPVAIVGGAWVQSWGNLPPWAAGGGILLAVGLFVFVMKPLHDWLWDQIFERRPVAALAWPLVGLVRRTFRLFTGFARWSPQGFFDPATDKMWGRHAFAFLQLLLSIVFYALLFATKQFGTGPPRVPTLCYLLILAMLACWALAGVTFVIDRFRVPVLAVIVAYGTLVSVFPQGDHFFPSRERDPAANRQIDAAQVLAMRAGQPAVVVAAAGGGIQAAAWTARVLAGLQAAAARDNTDFDKALIAVSGVSGGSTGAMYFVDAYDTTTGRLPAMVDINQEPSVRAAEAGSLDEIAWGLTYPDLVWSLAPFLKGLSLWPPEFGTGRTLVADRGTALENTWKRTPTLQHATLDMWRQDLANGRRPAVLFNATVAETGAQMLLGTTTMKPSPYRVDFANDPNFAKADVAVVTAARLSATFPVVSPPARIQRHGIYDSQVHAVDGGYYDNYGTTTLLEWLEQGLRDSQKPKPSRILILQIRSFPSGAKAAPSEAKRGWIFEALQPVETLANVRSTGQLAQSSGDVDLITHFRQHQVVSCVIEFPRHLADERDDKAPPLSWYLTPDDRRWLRAAWEQDEFKTIRAFVQAFVKNTDAAIPPLPGACVK